MHRGLLTCLFSTSLVLTQITGQASASTVDLYDYFPLELGLYWDSWGKDANSPTWEWEEHAVIGDSHRNLGNGVQVFEEFYFDSDYREGQEPVSSELLSYDADYLLWHGQIQYGSPDWDDTPQGEYRADPPIRFKRRLAVGESFQSATVLTGPNGSEPLPVTIKLLGIEGIMVPAGDFPDCLRLAMEFGDESSEQWWCRGVGGVKYVQKTSSGTWDLLTELTASNHSVTAVAGSGGTVAPDRRLVVTGATAEFTVSPGSGYSRNGTVGGNCPQGSWSGNTWTTGTIDVTCTVSFSFTAISPGSYTVTPSAGAGGSVNPNTPQQVSAGAKKSFTVTANVGYTPSATVGGTCPKGGWTGNTWTTGAVNASCSVSFSFQQASRFNDVPPTHWAWPHIVGIADAGITTGCGPSLYCPESLVTRSEMAAFLLRGIHGGDYAPPEATGTRFSDVPKSYWAAGWIEQLATEGVTLGCGGGRYCPNNSVTRAEMAVFLLRSKYGSSYNPPAATGNRFKDVPKSYWAASWVEKLAAEGVTTGCGGGNYCPDNSVTRAEMAVFLARNFDLPLPPRP